MTQPTPPAVDLGNVGQVVRPSTAPAAEPADHLEPLHPAAIGFTLFRELPSGAGRAYSSVEFTRGWAGADHFRRQLRAFGFVQNCTPAKAYGLLDAIDAEGDIVQTYDIPTARAFAYIKRKLKLTVTHTDGGVS